MHNILYNHLSSLTCAKQGFKPTYNVADELGLFTLLGVVFSSKVAENHFLLFYGIWGPKSKGLNFWVTLNGARFKKGIHTVYLTPTELNIFKLVN